MNGNGSKLWRDINGAFEYARAYSSILIVERDPEKIRAALADHFIGKALMRGDGPQPCQAYVSLHGHPHLPAKVICDGHRSTLVDLAEGPTGMRPVANLIVIDGPESMALAMPARLRRFVSCCAEQAETVVVLTENAQRLFDCGIDGTLMIVWVSAKPDFHATAHGCGRSDMAIQIKALIRPGPARRGDTDERK